MATLLYRLGRFAYRRAWIVIAAWLVAVGIAVGLGLGLGGTLKDSFAIPGTESQHAIDQLAAVFPQTAGAAAEVIVRDGDGGQLEDHLAAIDDFVETVADIVGIEGAVSPFDEYATDAVNEAGTTGIVQVTFSGSAEEVADASIVELRAAAEPLEAAGLEVVFGGAVFQDLTIGLSIIEVFGVVFAALVLLVTFGSFVAAGLPLLSALLGLGASLPLVLFAAAFATISTTTPMLGLMIGLAVGIDYALFILMRHRQQLAGGMDPEESAAVSVATAGGSVVFAGVTVVIALVGMVIVGIPFLGSMGVAAAGSVIAAMLAAVTLLPAVMGLLGRRLAPKPGSRAARRALAAQAELDGAEPPPHRPSMGERWVRTVLKAPVVAIVGVVAVLGTLAIPAFSLQLALPTPGDEPEGTEIREAYDLIAEEFGPGRNGPLIVTVDITQTVDVLDDLESIAARLGALDGVAAVSKGAPNATLDTGVIQVIPETGPTDPATAGLVHEIRAIAPEIDARYGTPIAVTGRTAVQIDVSQRLNEALLPFGLVVVGLSVVLLALVFRSILVPVKAALGYLLSVFAAFGVVVAVFQWGWGAELIHAQPGPILSFMPIIIMAILFGLAMDYEVFLVSGMREAYVHGTARRVLDARQRSAVAREAVVRGFAGAARVVTAAALIMFFVFAAFVPEGMSAIKVIALGLAVGIAVDAFLVRMTLVPAVMALAGRHAWSIPRWLDRLLPDVDVEGVQLDAHRSDAAWAAERLAAGEAVTVDGLVVGEESGAFGPVRFSAAQGSIALVGDFGLPAGERRLVGAVIAGRVPALAGRAQLLGHPLPSDAARVARLVALAEVDGPDRSDGDPTLGRLMGERLRLTGPLRGLLSSQRRARSRIDRLDRVLRDLGRPYALSPSSGVAALPQVERALALTAVALAEGTPVLLLDGVDRFSSEAEATAFLVGLALLVPADVTVVVAVPGLAGVPAPERVRIASTGRRSALTSPIPLVPLTEGALR